MFKSGNIKRLLFEVILLLFSIGLFLWVCTPFKSPGEQFTFTIIGVMITVFVIDYLLTEDKKQRYKFINKGVGEEIVTISQVNLLKILDSTFEYLKTSEEKSIQNIGDINYTRDKVNSFLVSAEYSNWLSSLTLDQDTLRKIDDLHKKFSNFYKNLRKSLHKIQPYPDPSLLEDIKKYQAKIDGSAMAINIIIKEFGNGLPEKLKANVEDKQKSEELVSEVMPIFIKGLVVGFNENSNTLGDAIRENLEFIQLIAERAKSNNLEFSLE